jgi:UTP-glucose-1-phosphate uridylyltransferase
MKPTLLVLAAGMGSRYGGLKQMDPVGLNDETILEFSVYDAIKAGFGKVVFIIRKSFEIPFKEKIGATFENLIAVEYVYQESTTSIAGLLQVPEREKPWGTGHAVLVAADVIQEPFAVINADDFYGYDSFSAMANFLTAECESEKHAMIGYHLDHTLSDFGAVSRGVCTRNESDFLTSIAETHQILKNDRGITGELNGSQVFLPEKTLVSMNFWGFHPSIFEYLRLGFIRFVDENINHPKAEYYIPLVVNQLLESEQAKFLVIPSEAQWFGVTYQEDKPFVKDALKSLTEEGTYPASGLWSKDSNPKI